MISARSGPMQPRSSSAIRKFSGPVSTVRNCHLFSQSHLLICQKYTLPPARTNHCYSAPLPTSARSAVMQRNIALATFHRQLPSWIGVTTGASILMNERRQPLFHGATRGEIITQDDQFPLHHSPSTTMDHKCLLWPRSVTLPSIAEIRRYAFKPREPALASSAWSKVNPAI